MAHGLAGRWAKARARLLDEHDELSRAQKERVREQLDRWFVEEAGP